MVSLGEKSELDRSELWKPEIGGVWYQIAGTKPLDRLNYRFKDGIDKIDIIEFDDLEERKRTFTFRSIVADNTSYRIEIDSPTVFDYELVLEDYDEYYKPDVQIVRKIDKDILVVTDDELVKRDFSVLIKDEIDNLTENRLTKIFSIINKLGYDLENREIYFCRTKTKLVKTAQQEDKNK